MYIFAANEKVENGEIELKDDPQNEECLKLMECGGDKPSDQVRGNGTAAHHTKAADSPDRLLISRAVLGDLTPLGELFWAN